jgi:hypothetical protein
MLSERIQRAMMGTMFLVILYLYNTNEIIIANILLVAVTSLVFIWAVFDFCPSLWSLKKIFKEN